MPHSPALFDTAGFLKHVPLFAGLDDAAMRVFVRVSRQQQIPAGHWLFCQDDTAESAFVLHSGRISILLTTPDGRELIINEMCPGECFGEVALLTGGSRTASARACEPSQLLVIPRAEFLGEIQRQPQLLRSLVETLAERLRASTERESAFAFLDASARLARVLLELDRASSAAGYVTVSQEGLAERIGISRQTTATILGEWRRRGWIITGRGKTVVLDRTALRTLQDNA